MPTRAAARLGTAIHESTAVFDKARMNGEEMTPYDAASVLVDTIWDVDAEVVWDDITPSKAEGIGLNLHSLYCTEWSPKFEFLDVEMTIEPLEIDCGDGVTIQLTGTLDRSRVVKGSKGVGISDLKTGKTSVQKGAAKTAGHLPQIGTYELLYEHTTGNKITQPGEIIGLKTSGSPEIATGTIKGAKAAMVGDESTTGLIEYAAQYFKTGLFPPNPSSFLCGKKYCPMYSKCKFR